MTFAQALGEAIRRRRRVMHLSQEDLARVVGITQASVSNYERGKRDLPLSTALAMARELYPDLAAGAGVATFIQRAARLLKEGHPADRRAA